MFFKKLNKLSSSFIKETELRICYTLQKTMQGTFKHEFSVNAWFVLLIS